MCHAATNTLRITWRFLRWLREHDADLQHLPQTVLDQWSTEHPDSVADVAVFLRWAARNTLTGTAAVNDPRRWGPPGQGPYLSAVLVVETTAPARLLP